MSDELNFELEAECVHCDHKEQIYVRECDYNAWHNGEFIQDVMSYLSAAQRELIISGTCDSCWQKFFPDEDDE